MLDKGLNSALNCSEVQGQTVALSETKEKSDAFSLVDQPSLFAPADNSSKEVAVFEETAGMGERKAGRPKGARNKSTKEWVDYFMNKIGESPLIVLGKLYTKDTKELAREMCCDRLDALKMQISAASAVLPYVHQKQPVAIEVASEELPTIQIFTSPTVYQQINNGNGQVKREIIVDGIASTTPEQISLENKDLAIDTIAESDNKV